MSSTVVSRAHARRLLHVVGTSAAAIAAGLAMPAHAQCSPSPAQGNATTTCSGTEPNGLNVTGNPTVNLPTGATILAPNAGASAVRVSSAIAGADPFSNFPTLFIDGAVVGGASGISVDSRTATGFSFGPSINPQINVGPSGSVTGVIGINLIGNPANSQFDSTQARLRNGGVISGTGGFAILATNPDRAYFQSIDNLAGGRIGAINAYVVQLTNAGTIDGGANSAYSYAALPQFATRGAITNRGTITSASSFATIAPGADNPGGFGLPITNTGTISNTGTGKAIVTTSLIQLTNRGTIIGTIDASASDPSLFPPWSLGHRIDTSGGGIINGSVLFGPGQDTLIVDFGTPANPIGGISGSVDGGLGNDLLQLKLKGDTVLSSAVAGAQNFETVAFAVPFNTVLTLAPGFAAPNGVRFASETGTVVNNAVLVTSGPAFAPESSGATGPSIVNNGAITASLQNYNDAAVRAAAITNTGSITAINGGGVTISSYGGRLTNSGSITAAGVAASTGSGGLNNSGLLESTGGIGLVGGGVNTGTIRGATAGAQLSGTLDNSGTIQSANTGIQLEWQGVVNNKAGGIISGGVKAIGSGTSGFVVTGTVDNAGTINGHVDFGNALFGNSYNRFVARAGSVVNGNLHLGNGGDTLVAEFGGSGPLGGVTGTITGNGFETLHYLVSADATAQVGALGVFDAVVYDLNNATLNLSTAGPLALNLSFAGKGTVNFSGTLSGTTTNDDLVSLDLRRTSLHTGSDGARLKGLTVVNSGSISRTRNSTSAPAATAVWSAGISFPGSNASFTNTGTITVLDTGPANPFSTGLTGITGDGLVTNSGLIQVGGAVGVMGYGEKLTLTNSGSILQLAGQSAGRGVVGVGLLTNTGTISTGGDAVTAGSGYSGYIATVVNSGTIASSGGYGFRSSAGLAVAVTNEAGGSISGALGGVVVAYGNLTNSGSIASAGTGVLLGPGGNVDNRAGGVISGTTLAIGRDIASAGFNPTAATIRNAGVITGDVHLGTASSPTRNTFIALDGGVVNGNLHLGSGGDTLVVRYGAAGPLGGVTGAITGGGNETLRYLIDADATVALDTTSIFNTIGFDLAGNATVTATANGPKAMNLEFAGVGTVDLDVDITGNAAVPTLNLAATSVQPAGDPPVIPQTKLVVTSRGSISATADASTPLVGFYPTQSVSPVVATQNGNTFTNEGTITAHNLAFASRSMAAIGGGGTVVNNGAIVLDGAVGIDAGSSGILNVTNTGSILQQGAASRGIVNALTVDNSGTIRTAGTAVLLAGSGIASGQRELTNTGTIESTAGTGIEYLDIYYAAKISNAAGGVITGSTNAILLGNGLLDNSGTLNGLVNLASSYYRNVTFNNRGAVNGNVLFGAGNDTLTAFDTGTISGTIDGGAGIDTYVRAFTANASVDLGAAATGVLNFERLGVSAFGADTTVSVSNSAGVTAGGSLFGGDGTIVSDLEFATSGDPLYYGQTRANAVILGSYYGAGSFYSPGTSGSQLAVVNHGVMGDGAIGLAKSFENTGTVGSSTLRGSVLHLYNGPYESFSLVNTGAILSAIATDLTGGADIFSPAVLIDPVGVLPLGENASIRNESTIDGGLQANLRFRDIAFANSGTITARTFTFGVGQSGMLAAVSLNAMGGSVVDDSNTDRLTFDNSGRVIGNTYINGSIDQVSFVNSGEMREIGIFTNAHYGQDSGPTDQTLVGFDNSGSVAGTVLIDASSSVDFTNSGSILAEREGVGASTVEIGVDTLAQSRVDFTNSGTISASGPALSSVLIGATSLSAAARQAGFDPTDPAVADAPGVDIVFTNSGTIAANGGAVYTPGFTYPAYPTPYQVPPQIFAVTAVGIAALGEGETSIAITNTATGVISANGAMTAEAGDLPPELQGLGSLALTLAADRVSIVNAGTITGSAGNPLPDGAVFNTFGPDLGDLTYLAGAIQTFGSLDTVTNAATGTIIGSIDLGGGDDRLENGGLLRGTTYLGLGDDTLVFVAGGVIDGLVDGGAGTDAVLVLASGHGSVVADTLAGFERLDQSGTGTIAYSGTFGVDTIGLSASSLRVDAGATLATAGATTVTGTSGSETVTVAGTLAGAIALGDGNDRFSEIGGGRATGAVDGGGGRDLYAVTLSGDRAGVSQVSGFEELLVDGGGTLTLDRSFELVSLAGANLVVSTGAGAGAIQGSAAAERVTSATDLARVSLGGGDDTLSLGATTLAGSYLGEGGADTLALTAAGPVTLSGTIAGFEQIALTGGALSVAGTLGAAGETTSLGDGAQTLTVLAGARLPGTVDLGAGDDQLRVQNTALGGRVEGGAGTDTVTIAMATDTVLSPLFGGFEQLRTEGSGTLSLADVAFQFDRVDAATDLRIAAGASLTAPQVAFGARDDRMTIEGGFAGSIAGGAGNDTLTVSGGTAGAPVRFASISEFEAFAMTGGFAVLSGQAQFGTLTMTGGQFTGLAGSTLSATTIAVSPGAIFGSAGTVNSGLSIASGATLSPGASPAVMTVNGNVSLAGGSTTLFEFVPAPGQSDQLLINGTLTIASGAILNLTGNRPLTPGVAYDMIVANSITGQFTIGTWDRNAVQGFLRYLDGASQDRLQLLGTFVSLAPLPGAAGTAVTYVNDLLVSGGASSALLNSVNTLLDSNGFASAQAFGLLSPEAYASAIQLGTENGLVIAKAGRSGVMDGAGERPALFTFGTGTGAWRTLDAVAETGASGVKNNVYEVLGGIGYGSEHASLSGFVGYLDGQQRIAALGAETDADGIVAGVSGHVALGGLQLHALVSYDWSSADTSRAAPGAVTVSSDYDLNSLVLDAMASYDAPLGQGLVITPVIGITHIATDRDATRESGSAAFALDVDGDSHAATFIDGAIALRGPAASPIRPWAEIGVRHQLSGSMPFASGGFVGTTARFVVPGVSREETVITYGAGFEASVAGNVSLFAGYHGESGDGSGSNFTGGMHIRF